MGSSYIAQSTGTAIQRPWPPVLSWTGCHDLIIKMQNLCLKKVSRHHVSHWTPSAEQNIEPKASRVTIINPPYNHQPHSQHEALPLHKYPILVVWLKMIRLFCSSPGKKPVVRKDHLQHRLKNSVAPTQKKIPQAPKARLFLNKQPRRRCWGALAHLEHPGGQAAEGEPLLWPKQCFGTQEWRHTRFTAQPRATNFIALNSISSLDKVRIVTLKAPVWHSELVPSMKTCWETKGHQPQKHLAS